MKTTIDKVELDSLSPKQLEDLYDSLLENQDKVQDACKRNTGKESRVMKVVKYAAKRGWL